MSGKAIPQDAPHRAFRPLSGPGVEVDSLPAVAKLRESISRIRDLADGACLLAQVLEHEANEGAFHDGRPMFTARDQERLCRLLVTAASLAADQAELLLSETATSGEQGGQ